MDTASPDSGFLSSQRSRTTALGLVIGLVHIFLLQYFVPLENIFSSRPIQGVDYDLHIGQVFRVVESLEREGRAWNYDVQLLAGQPEGTILDAGCKAWGIWTFALHHYLGVSREIAFNSFVLLVMLSCPVLLGLAAYLLRFGPRASIIAAGMGSILWYFDSFIHWLWFVGMVSWALASCLALVTFALFYRFTEDGRRGLAFPCSVCLGVGLLIHPYTFLVLMVPMAVCYLRQFRRMDALAHAGVALMVLIAFAINGYWLDNAYRHWHYILNSAFFAQARPEFLLCDFLSVLCSAADTGVIGVRTGFRFFFIALGIAGLWLWRTECDRRFLPVAANVIALFCFAYLGKYLFGLGHTQPYRQLAPAIWFATLPASFFVDRLVRSWKWSVLSPLGKIAVALASFALAHQLLTNQVMYFLPRTIPDPKQLLDGTRSPLSEYGFWSMPHLESHIHYGLPHSPTVEFGIREAMDWISHNIPPRSRILVEGGVIGERLAWSTDHEILGGFVERNLQHVDANFFRRFGQVVASTSQLARYKHVYAVDWVISVGRRPEFERSPDLWEHVATVVGRDFYRARAPSSRVLLGGGNVTAKQNRLDVKGSDPTEAVVLSYHFHEALRCRPNCRVERERVDIDRVGLIRIPTPHPSTFTVYNSYTFAETAPTSAP